MYTGENDKITSCEEYFYNEYIDMYCIAGTTISMESINDLVNMFASPDLLTEIPMPAYVTEDYDEPEW